MLKIETDDTLRELAVHGTPAFPFQYYYDDVGKYAGQSIDWHWHREFELAYLMRGAVNCRIGQETVGLAAGDGIFINADAIHRFEAPEGAEMPNILFVPEFIAAAHTTVFDKYVRVFLDTPLSHIPLRQDTPGQRDVLQCLRDVCTAVQSEPEAAELDVQIKTARMWLALYRHFRTRNAAGSGNPPGPVQARIRKMLRYIQDNYGARMSLSDIARSADVSKSEALRCFRASVQTSPICYLNSYRMQQAKRLLLITDETVSGIALHTGFDSISYFNRLFKQTFGMTPKEIRGRNR